MFAEAKKSKDALRSRVIAAEFSVEGFAVESKDLCGLGLVAADGFEDFEDVAFFDFVERDHLGGVSGGDDDMRVAVVADFFGEIFDDDLVGLGESDGAFDTVSEFADISGPVVGEELFCGP